MTETQQLLADYVKRGSESAFRELVLRYTDLVYSVALRATCGNSQLAEDIGQTVFSDLSRKAATLSPKTMLGGWLHRHTCFVAATVMRAERRRQKRECHVAQMNAIENHGEDHLARVAPVLDDAINQLDSEDRTAILMRYFEERNLHSIAEAIGTTDNTARMRVARALGKLERLLRQRGVTISASALGTVLAGNAVTAAPIGLALSFSSTALIGSTSGTGLTLSGLKIIAMTNLKLGSICALLAAGVTTGLLIKNHSQVKFQRQNELLLQQVARLQSDNESLSNKLARAKKSLSLRLPAPYVQIPAVPVDDLQSTNLYARLKDKSPKLSSEQAEAYLKANGRTAASLLAAFRTTDDPGLLEEAKQKYPNDPQVAFEAAFQKEATPEQRRNWLEALKRSAPDNALANYLSAQEYFKSGQTDRAVEELIAASGKTEFQDYTQERIQDDEEAYLTSGYSVAEAKTVSSMQLLLPQLAEIKQLCLSTVELANSYRQAGDESSAQSALQMAVNLGTRYGNNAPGEPVINQLVGNAVQRIALGKMDPASPYGSDGQTVQDQLDQLNKQNTAVREMSQKVESLLPMMSEQDWISYKDRWRVFGEDAAFRWVIGKYGQK
jgi:RNA polymerase sigma factor (sigma-70 family)